MKLNIETVQKVAEVAELIGERAHIQINSHDYKSYEEAQKEAKAISEELGLNISEGKSSNGSAWITMKDKEYGTNIEITLYYKIESEVAVNVWC